MMAPEKAALRSKFANYEPGPKTLASEARAWFTSGLDTEKSV